MSYWAFVNFFSDFGPPENISRNVLDMKDGIDFGEMGCLVVGYEKSDEGFHIEFVDSYNVELEKIDRSK